jgi:bifunctional DNA-binding transcriptional regulator/antitoxin component of YhaV-PrlF toxin-antitoxin module
MRKKYFDVTLIEADDGSGDLILPFPDELLKELGWKAGDVVDVYVDSSGKLAVRKLPK